jgi:hypothetical protein
VRFQHARPMTRQDHGFVFGDGVGERRVGERAPLASCCGPPDGSRPHDGILPGSRSCYYFEPPRLTQAPAPFSSPTRARNPTGQVFSASNPRQSREPVSSPCNPEKPLSPHSKRPSLTLLVNSSSNSRH